jgi:hypothetical protein
MSVNVKDNTAMIILQTQRNSSLALRFMLDDMHSIAEPKTPKDKGILRGNVLKTVSGLRGTIKWLAKYAIYQELKKFENYTTGGTGPHFAKNSAEAISKSPQGAMRRARLI